MSRRILILSFCVLLSNHVEATRSGYLQASPKVMERKGSDLSEFYALFGSDETAAKQPCVGSSCPDQRPNRFPTRKADASDFDFLFRTFNDHSKTRQQ
uniref:Uncharacterized protein n=1 Tax=Daphnia galeata TaxID=27404 RepID=A0A8J2RRL5_9CRUS|nr:unnamed protein product [Daphnia galeata]